MNVLVTGGTGFLGKFVVQGLVKDPKIKNIYVTSRKRVSFPHKHVHNLRVDLSKPIPEDLIDIESIDTVIHLAGEYDFEGTYERSYMGNVLATSNLLDFITNAKRDINFLYASTYAILPYGATEEITEMPLSQSPKRQNHYAYTKAIAENLVLNSGLNGVCFRIGILVGDSQEGLISKINGPYYFLRMAERLNKIPFFSKSIFFTLPGEPTAKVPVLAVDEAAAPFVQAASRKFDEMNICGLFNKNSTTVEVIAKTIFKVYLPTAKLFYFKYVPKTILEKQELITGVPADSIDYLSAIESLSNQRFLELFPDLEPTHFLELKKTLFHGYQKYNEGIVT